MTEETRNPLAPEQPLKRPLEGQQLEEAHPPQPIFPEDSAVTKAEKIERNGVNANTVEAAEAPITSEVSGPPSKRIKVDEQNVEAPKVDARDKVKGIALVKPEYLIDTYKRTTDDSGPRDDDAAEGRGTDSRDSRDNGGGRDGKKKKKEKGQNKKREFGSWFDKIRLCNTLATSSEFSPKPCKFGEKCNCSHDLREYLKDGKREDLATFGGWKCRFVASHSEEVVREDGRKELVLIEKDGVTAEDDDDNENRKGIVNVVGTEAKLQLAKRKTKTDKADAYLEWMEKDARIMEKIHQAKRAESETQRQEARAEFVDPPFLPSEKRRIYYGPETPVLAPLTTQGNLPFRRMCVEFGAQLTYSEMAMSLPIIQGQKGEWALMKAHESEISPPRYSPTSIVQDYDNSKDLKFGAQISASKPWQAVKTTEILSRLVPHLRVIDLNCGCPIDLVFQQGAGSALLDAPSKLEKMIRGMNMVSGDIPISAKIRMGTMDSKPTAQKTIERLAFGGHESDRLGAPGCAAITLHGRSRQQRYTKNADWSYIAECAALVKSYNNKKDELTDTVMEPDARTLPNAPDGRMYFIGNGDCYSHVQYLDDIQNGGVDSVMVARGALIKPWIFEEIEKGQYLDKSASERLGYVEKFVRHGLEAWGSDEVGVGQTRRFLLEWLSFAHRYVPVGILDHLPPSLQDRPPAYRGRSDLETLLASENYLDWVKISEMFLGPAHKDFRFQPKHKSNSYDIEAEG
ncbi:tRNA-dihydrouridine(47) synthase [NAD(P)(+)] [Lachnellula hyalina]|uniref:tRNA-dihydrouridine(47) synthase [NAD(P)(+)] n=1 Tax=Lachnellula hyalina TaxID=1316788 RepID=A0A8H8R7X6_9HELO|nr:tRNA-dihydrouridine(47) synthase [NAD(P)(+)] [Lachnellula hyalina]TVY29994.1 tRNA-dihydrouridine(47) synthase [NAD(P)(+)] [Lachnellula hyalina]